MPADITHLNRLRDIAMTKMKEYPARCRISGMIVDMTDQDLVNLAWYEAGLIINSQRGLIPLDEINKEIPKLIQVTQESNFDE